MSYPLTVPTRIRCVVEGCDWSYERRPEVDPGALASVFGHGVLSAVQGAHEPARAESAIRRHMTSDHKIEDFLRTITKLRSENTELIAAIQELTQ